MKSFFDFYEEALAAPTNNVGGGNIAGTKPAGDDPPVIKENSSMAVKGQERCG